MANSLTSIDSAYWSKQQISIDQIKLTTESNLAKQKNSNFDKLLNNAINKNGKIDQSLFSKKEKKLYGTCVELESLLWKQVLNSMKKTIGKYKLLDGGQGEDIFSDFLYDEYSMMLAKNGSSNIANNIFKQLSGYNK